MKKPAAETTYVVYEFQPPHWTTVLTTKDEQKALKLLKALGDKGKLEKFPTKKKRPRPW